MQNPEPPSIDGAGAGVPSAEQSRAGLYIKTFGCQMNEYDSEKVRQLLARTHYSVEDPEQAEVVFVNTCSVREKGEHKLFSLLGSLRELKSERPNLIVGVGGCVAQQEGESIMKRSPTVDFVVGTHNLSLVSSLVQSVRDGRGRQVAVNYREDWESLPEFGLDSDETALEALRGKPRALIAISRGCNKNCSFCVVPTTRGPEVSRNPEEILREARLKVRLGAKEILLLGQTVNSYGRDLAPRYPFETLIRELAAIDGVRRIRFTSPHPAEVRAPFLDLYRDVPQLCPHIHLPLQSGSDRLLKLMNRNYRSARYLEIVAGLRERCPELAVTTDVIVGFPTESEEDFQASLEMMRQVRYLNSYSFKYSRRPNTTAIDTFGPEEEVPDETAHRRLLELQQLQTEISRELNAERLGAEVEVLVEEAGPELSSRRSGRSPQNTPVELSVPEALDRGRDGTSVAPIAGDIVRARVDRTTAYGLHAVALEIVNRP